jgi:hypothetical protein
MAVGRKTGGRTKGTPNKATVARQQFVEGIAASALEELDEVTRAKLSPLEVMLLAMRASLKARKLLEAAQLAAMVAPYCHHRLTSSDMHISNNDVVYVVADEPMSAEEWTARYASAHSNDTAAPGLLADERQVGD